MRSGRISSQDGFTLLEMLVALVLLAAMASYSVSAISAFKQVRRIEVASSAVGEMRLARQHLSSVLADIRISYEETDGVSALLFEGRPQSLRIASELDQRFVRGGLHQLRYAFDIQTGELKLNHSVIRQGVQIPGEDSVVVLRNLQSVKFSYYGFGGEETAPTWRTTWPFVDTLPQQVKLEITFTDTNIVWLPLVVAVQAFP
jgi:prepilin-type N-terminal cleavage/methylation domain-containing protein